MKTHSGRVSAAVLMVVLGACTSTSNPTESMASVEPAGASVASASRTEAEHFPIEAFADISKDPVSEETAAELQALLDELAGRAGMAATVMSPDGTWSGATGKADGVRDVRGDDQFAIFSITKSIIAAQVMQMVEAGELDLDDPATDHLPADLDFDTNGATIRDLLGHRTGIPEEDYAEVDDQWLTQPRRFWTPAEMLELVPIKRARAGEAFEYANANYIVLGLVIEEVRGRPVAGVLRDGVLDIDGVERLIYQPDEKPTEPIAMPGGQSTAALKENGGYLPSLAAASFSGTAAGMASDAPPLARWWRALCAGEIVSQASLNKMTTLSTDGYGNTYGLGLYDAVGSYEQAVGHSGEGIKGHGGVLEVESRAGCVPEEHAIVVVLSNRMLDISEEVALALVETASSD